jgi:hypothetical protein
MAALPPSLIRRAFFGKTRVRAAPGRYTSSFLETLGRKGLSGSAVVACKEMLSWWPTVRSVLEALYFLSGVAIAIAAWKALVHIR